MHIEQLPMAERLCEEDKLSREYLDILANKNRYQGPLPDKVARVDLANWGESAAFGKLRVRTTGQGRRTWGMLSAISLPSFKRC